MITSRDFSRRSLSYTAEELVEAWVPFVEGVIYRSELEEGLVTPVRTFNGYVCDCRVLRAKGGGYEVHPGFQLPIPVRIGDLGEPVAVIL